MGYLDIINIVFGAIFTVFSLIVVHFVVFAIVGLFTKKKFPHTDTKLKYGIIIPARNEESVVGNLIDSVRKNNYPQDKLDIFVIAHNCSDNTANVAREHGAIVYEYNNPAENTMGYAFKYLFERIKEDYGILSYDGYFLFNADNILDVNYFDKMNDAFVARDRKSVITSFRNSKNFGENLISACYGLYFMYGCHFESRGRSVLGCSTRVQGTGYVINSEIVKDGWQYVTLTEDWEFTADRVLKGEKIYYCDEAVFYDEQPTSFRVMFRQRTRWAKGHLLVFLTRFRDMMKGLFTPKSKGGVKNKGSAYDISVNILPVFVILAVATLLQIVCLMLAPFFGDYSFSDVMLGYLKQQIPGWIISYATVLLATIVLFIAEHKRIKNVNPFLKILAAIVWPIFLALSGPCELVALFWRNLGWKPIPHKNTTDFDALNKAEATAIEAAAPADSNAAIEAEPVAESINA